MELNLMFGTIYRKITLVLMGVLLISGTWKATAQQTFTLEESITYALENNISLKRAANQGELSELELQNARLALYPTLNGNASQNFNFGRGENPNSGIIESNNSRNFSFSLGAGVTLFSGFQRINSIARAKADMYSSQSNVEDVEDEVTLNVVTYFLQILYAQEQVAASAEQVAVSKAQVDNAQKKVDAGAMPKGELLQLRAQQATDELSLTEAQNQLDIGIIQLKQAMNFPNTDELVIERPSDIALAGVKTDYEFVEVFQEAVKINPKVERAMYDAQSAAIGIKIAKGGYSPTLSLNAGLNSSYYYSNLLGDLNTSFSNQIDENFGQGLGLSLSIPIFNGLQVRNNVKRAKIQFSDAESAVEQAENQLGQTIAQSVADLKAAEKRYKSASESYESSKLAYEYAQKRYDVGMTNTVELNLAKSNFSKAQVDMLQAKYDLIFKSKVIDFYLGRQIAFF